MQTTDHGLPAALNQPLTHDELDTAIRLLDRLARTGSERRRTVFEDAAFLARMENHEARRLAFTEKWS